MNKVIKILPDLASAEVSKQFWLTLKYGCFDFFSCIKGNFLLKFDKRTQKKRDFLNFLVAGTSSLETSETALLY